MWVGIRAGDMANFLFVFATLTFLFFNALTHNNSFFNLFVDVVTGYLFCVSVFGKLEKHGRRRGPTEGAIVRGEVDRPVGKPSKRGRRRCARTWRPRRACCGRGGFPGNSHRRRGVTISATMYYLPFSFFEKTFSLYLSRLKRHAEFSILSSIGIPGYTGRIHWVETLTGHYQPFR